MNQYPGYTSGTNAEPQPYPSSGSQPPPPSSGINHHHHHHHHNQSHHHHNHHRGGPFPGVRSPIKRQPAADICLVVHRVHLFDTGHSEDDRIHHPSVVASLTNQYHVHGGHGGRPPDFEVGAACRVSPAPPLPAKDATLHSVVVACRIAPETHPSPISHRILPFPVVDNTTPNPFGVSIDKYWQQRRRLFSRFDEGIQLDEEGWFSVTPEQIADHVAIRVSELLRMEHKLTRQQPVVLLDAFCGCGGNSIAFSRQPNMIVYAVDTDRTKLRKAAHNAAIYQIPPQNIVFIECNVLFILEFCFKNGNFILDQPIDIPEKAAHLMQSMPPPVPCETYAGYSIGGIDMLPTGIDLVFLDPPWGGVDYEVFGKHGYDLEKNMKIKRPAPPPSVPSPSSPMTTTGALADDFFDSFISQPRSRKERVSQFNCRVDQDNCVNGADLLALAAAATSTGWVVYDIPRNTNHKSLGRAALIAGYRGNAKVEEHFLNGRLKTVTAYLGPDYRALMNASGAISVCTWNI